MAITSRTITVVADQEGEGWYGEAIGGLPRKAKLEGVFITQNIDEEDGVMLRLEEVDGWGQRFIDDVVLESGGDEGARIEGLYHLDALCHDKNLQENGDYQTYFLCNGQVRASLIDAHEGDTVTVELIYEI